MCDLIAETGCAGRPGDHVFLAVRLFQEIGQFTDRADGLIPDRWMTHEADYPMNKIFHLISPYGFCVGTMSGVTQSMLTIHGFRA